jgi:ssDNA-binding Zn-finger/Zn-ribbon topoisomerase 1
MQSTPARGEGRRVANSHDEKPDYAYSVVDLVLECGNYPDCKEYEEATILEADFQKCLDGEFVEIAMPEATIRQQRITSLFLLPIFFDEEETVPTWICQKCR